ncbi:ATP-binding cassette domain-containing protein [Pluralibacter gergoviae]
MNTEYLLEIEDLKKYFPVNGGLFGRKTGEIRAVDGVSFAIRQGTIFGLVGESGSGKTTVGRMLAGLHEPTSGRIRFRGDDLASLSPRTKQALRPEIQLVFQDPYSSLNPAIRVGDAIGEALLQHRRCSRAALYDTVVEVMRLCGLSAQHYHRFPHEFSGGQRQRIGIARALALNPAFIVADEPISALDVSIQAQIINLFSDLREHQGVTFLFISHDLGVVEHLCDDVAVMYLGQLVETASRDVLFSRPLHPYTRALLAAVPSMVPGRGLSTPLQGEAPDAGEPASGCRFCGRCPQATARCQSETPALRKISDGHHVACHQVLAL